MQAICAKWRCTAATSVTKRWRLPMPPPPPPQQARRQACSCRNSRSQPRRTRRSGRRRGASHLRQTVPARATCHRSRSRRHPRVLHRCTRRTSAPCWARRAPRRWARAPCPGTHTPCMRKRRRMHTHQARLGAGRRCHRSTATPTHTPTLSPTPSPTATPTPISPLPRRADRIPTPPATPRPSGVPAHPPASLGRRPARPPRWQKLHRAQRSYPMRTSSQA